MSNHKVNDPYDKKKNIYIFLLVHFDFLRVRTRILLNMLYVMGCVESHKPAHISVYTLLLLLFFVC